MRKHKIAPVLLNGLSYGLVKPKLGENPTIKQVNNTMRITEVDREIKFFELDSVERFADNMFGKTRY